MALEIDQTTKSLPSVLAPDQAAALFDQEARRIAGMSGERFLAKWDAGEIQTDDETRHGRELAYLILLIPFGRQHA
jgi:hypothetical protein